MFITERIKINADIRQAKALISNLSPSETATSQAARTALSQTQQALAKLDAYYAKHRFLGRLVKWIDQTFGAYKTLLKLHTSLPKASGTATPSDEGIKTKCIDPSKKAENSPTADPKKMPVFKKASDPEKVKNHTLIKSALEIRGNKWNPASVIFSAICQALSIVNNEMGCLIIKKNEQVKQISLLNLDNLDCLESQAERIMQNFFPSCRQNATSLSFGRHATLCFIDKDLRTVEFYDSKINYYPDYIRKPFLKLLADKMNKADPGPTPYQVIEKIKNYLQPDAYQCSIWVGFFLENRILNPDVDFNLLNPDECQEKIADYRLYLQEQIIQRSNIFHRQKCNKLGAN